jgi:hypothetical protein
MIKPINQKNFITETKLIQIKYIQNLNISRYAVVFNICQTIHINLISALNIFLKLKL